MEILTKVGFTYLSDKPNQYGLLHNIKEVIKHHSRNYYEIYRYLLVQVLKVGYDLMEGIFEIWLPTTKYGNFITNIYTTLRCKRLQPEQQTKKITLTRGIKIEDNFEFEVIRVYNAFKVW